MLLLILESLGSTELFFILLMALVFFGPRKLPQLSRTAGKHLAEFRKASEDFKRTWEREVALEDIQPTESKRINSSAENSILNPLEAAPADHVVARETVPITSEAFPSSDIPDESSSSLDQPAPAAPRKQDWL